LKLAKKIVVGIITSFLVYQSVGVQTGSAATYEEYPVSSGVKYKENREVINGYDQSIKVLEVNDMIQFADRLDKRLHERIIAQQEAIEQVSKAIKRSFAGLTLFIFHSLTFSCNNSLHLSIS